MPDPDIYVAPIPCRHCREPFKPRRRNQRHCSIACRKADYWTRKGSDDLRKHMQEIGRKGAIATKALRASGGYLPRPAIFAALRELSYRIERCGASPELTFAITLCSDLSGAIGNKWNPPDPYAAARVTAALAIADSGKMPVSEPRRS